MEEKKAQNINVIDLNGKSTLAKYMIFANGSSTRNVAAIADFVALELKNKTNITKIGLDGFREAQWIVLDANDIIVHIFHPVTRQDVSIEELWSNK